MFWFSRKCCHPAKHLAIAQGEDTVEPIDGEFSRITKHLHCRKCGASVDVSAAQLRMSVESFLRVQQA